MLQLQKKEFVMSGTISFRLGNVLNNGTHTHSGKNILDMGFNIGRINQENEFFN